MLSASRVMELQAQEQGWEGLSLASAHLRSPMKDPGQRHSTCGDWYRRWRDWYRYWRCRAKTDCRRRRSWGCLALHVGPAVAQLLCMPCP
jgi:hypothetical protein